MTTEPITLQLKDDQIFGLHACVPDADVARVIAHLRARRLDFEDAWPEAARLNEPGRQTVILLDPLEKVRKKLSSSGPVTLMPEIVTLPQQYDPPFAVLLELGFPDDPEDLLEGEPRIGSSRFLPEHVPTLIRMTADPELHHSPQHRPIVWAPIHALRELGALRAEEAITPLLDLLHLIDDEEDEWLGGEVPAALGLIGPASIAPAAAYLADPAHGQYARLAAATALRVLAQKYPEQRNDCINALIAQLDAHAMQGPDFNGLLIAELLDIPAPEAAPAIERAFTNGCVDESVAGDWEDVQIEFGLKSEREKPRKPNNLIASAIDFDVSESDEPIDLATDVSPLTSSVDSNVPFRAPPKVGRNDPCPCGSGKKFKKCCGG